VPNIGHSNSTTTDAADLAITLSVTVVLSKGDEIVLKDRGGGVYRCQVSETFVTDPTDVWVMGQVRGRDMVTLQTCTPYPTFEKRLIVRADRV
jgi:sortase A